MTDPDSADPPAQANALRPQLMAFGLSVASDTVGSLVAAAIGFGFLQLLGVLNLSTRDAWIGFGILIAAAGFITLVVVVGGAIGRGELLGVGQIGAAAEGWQAMDRRKGK